MRLLQQHWIKHFDTFLCLCLPASPWWIGVMDAFGDTWTYWHNFTSQIRNVENVQKCASKQFVNTQLFPHKSPQKSCKSGLFCAILITQVSVFKLLSDNTTIGLELKRKVLEFFKWQGKDLILKILNLYKLFLFVHWQKWQKCLSEHVLQLFSLFTKCAALNGELSDKFSKSST